MADPFFVGFAPPEFGDDATGIEHDDAVGELEDLVELRRHEKNADAAFARLQDPAVDELDRADVDPAGRLGDDEDFRIFLELARESFAKLQQQSAGDLEKRQQAIDAMVKPLRESLQQVDAKIGAMENVR